MLARSRAPRRWAHPSEIIAAARTQMNTTLGSATWRWSARRSRRFPCGSTRACLPPRWLTSRERRPVRATRFDHPFLGAGDREGPAIRGPRLRPRHRRRGTCHTCLSGSIEVTPAKARASRHGNGLWIARRLLAVERGRSGRKMLRTAAHGSPSSFRRTCASGSPEPADV